MMNSDNSQWNAFSNQQPGAGFGQGSNNQGAFGIGGLGQGAFGGNQYSTGQNWGAQQRQLTQQDVGAILQQIAPVLPQIIAQAQQQNQQYQPMAAYGGGFNQRTLSPQDVSEVVRQILPVIPQVLQSLQQQQGNQFGGFGHQGLGLGLGQQGWQGQGAYGSGQQQNLGNFQQQQRQLSHHDVNEIARQLTDAITQGNGGQQQFGQQFGGQRF